MKNRIISALLGMVVGTGFFLSFEFDHAKKMDEEVSTLREKFAQAELENIKSGLPDAKKENAERNSEQISTQVSETASSEAKQVKKYDFETATIYDFSKVFASIYKNVTANEKIRDFMDSKDYVGSKLEKRINDLRNGSVITKYGEKETVIGSVPKNADCVSLSVPVCVRGEKTAKDVSFVSVERDVGSEESLKFIDSSTDTFLKFLDVKK